MSDQIPLFVEDYEDAIRATIQALGGFKAVGAELKPDMGVMAAGRWLSDCCNPDRRERLSPTELAFLRRKARQSGCHILAAYEMRDAGYAAPTPVEPEDERAALMRQFVEQAKAMQAIVRQLGVDAGGHSDA